MRRRLRKENPKGSGEEDRKGDELSQGSRDFHSIEGVEYRTKGRKTSAGVARRS